MAAGLTGENGRVTAVELTNVTTNETKLVHADEVIVLYGFISSLGPIKEWDLELDKNALCVDISQQTSINGIFAAGDACTFDGKIKMITTGFGEVVVAINAATYGVKISTFEAFKLSTLEACALNSSRR